MSTRPFPCPGEPGWPLGTMFPSATSKSEGGMLRKLTRHILSCPFVFRFRFVQIILQTGERRIMCATL